MRKTRRKRRYTWLPIDGSTNTNDTVSTTTVLALDVTDAAPIGSVTTITFDQNQEALTGAGAMAGSTPLNDLLGEEYFLRRIVGKVWANLTVNVTTAALSGNCPAVCVTAAFYIARQDLLQVAQPIDWAAEASLYNPADTSVIREPWIWRRSWVLGIVDRIGLPPGITSVGSKTVAGTTYPACNADYGSVLDGPHIDAKTARRIRQEERLFFTAFAQTYPIGQDLPRTAGVADMQYVVDVGYDVRLLGALRKTRNRGSF